VTFETGSATDIPDLLTKLESFMTSVSPTAFSVDNAVAASSPIEFAFNDGDLGFWQIITQGATDEFIIHGSTSYSGAGVPNEPGQAILLADDGHRVNNIAGPYDTYYFYMNADPTVGPVYLYCVLEYAAGNYRHFHFGNIEKFGTWTGGAYYSGHLWEQGGNSDRIDITSHRIPWDSNGSDGRDQGHMRFQLDEASGFNGVVPSPSPKWGTPSTGSAGTDADGVAQTRIQWSIRNGWWGHHFFELGGSSQFNGFKPLMPIGCWLLDTTPTPDERYFLGFAKDVRYVNMDGVIPGQSIVQGGDTWDIFPLVKKRFDNDDLEGTGNMGIAYKRIV
jgi:hypothetical protein